VLPALCVVIVAGSSAQSQAPAPERPAFEVASIKLRQPTPPFRVSTEIGPAGIHYNNVTLKNCIRSAYGVEPYRILGGPDWINSERYEIISKAASAVPKAQLMLMLQTLIETRFGLKLHRETKELPVYALVVGKGGLKLHAGKEGGETEVGGARHLIDSRGMGMQQLAGFLSQFTQSSGMPVLDMTGVPGVFDVTLDFVSGDAADKSADPDIFTAVQELGLKLESRKSPLEVLVIDHVEKPSEN
jgi:uncharacterized protein (TIGR03435 family)